MSDPFLVLVDVVAISVLVFGLYFPRHRSRKMVVAYLVANMGVLAVADALLASTVTAGLGLGLFGVLSIIRLRSDELEQYEVAYYFAALALGLLGGLTTIESWVAPTMMGLIVAVVYVGDHPRLFGTYRSQMVTLDVAYLDEDELRARLEGMFGARVHRISVRKVDFFRNTTSVEVRYQVREDELPARSRR